MTTILDEGYTKKPWKTQVTCRNCWAVLSVRVLDLYLARTIYDESDETVDVYTTCPLCGHENYVDDYPPSIVNELDIKQTFDDRDASAIKNHELNGDLIVGIVFTFLVILAGFAVFFL